MVIERHNKPAAVVVSYEAWQAMRHQRHNLLMDRRLQEMRDNMRQDFEDTTVFSASLTLTPQDRASNVAYLPSMAPPRVAADSCERSPGDSAMQILHDQSLDLPEIVVSGHKHCPERSRSRPIHRSFSSRDNPFYYHSNSSTSSPVR